MSEYYVHVVTRYKAIPDHMYCSDNCKLLIHKGHARQCRSSCNMLNVQQEPPRTFRDHECIEAENQSAK